MLLGFAVTEHCNLRCPHCIRDDVTTVRSLDVAIFESVLAQALDLFASVQVSLTGGEPLLHPEFARLVRILAARGVAWRFVSNAWHLRRAMPVLDAHPPSSVRLSLSGATAEVHDAERGRGSFRRVLMGVALLTSRRIPTFLSLVVDRRDREQLRAAVDLAEALGCVGIGFILPQPTPGSAARDSDLPPEEWLPVRQEVEALAAEPQRRTFVSLDYGAPFSGRELLCETFRLERLYVDTRGRLCTCCQLSNYGSNETEVVADLAVTPLAEAYQLYIRRLHTLRRAQRVAPGQHRLTDPFPCLRCAQASRKLDWLQAYPRSPWHQPLNHAASAAAT